MVDQAVLAVANSEALVAVPLVEAVLVDGGKYIMHTLQVGISK